MVIEHEDECSIELEIANIISKNDGKTIFFPKVKNHSIPVISGLFISRNSFMIPFQEKNVDDKDFFSRLNESKVPATSPDSFIYKLWRAIENPIPPKLIDSKSRAPCQEIVEEPEFIRELPVLKHLPTDGGRYITSGVVIYNCPKYGRNISFHRLMLLEGNRIVARIVENRGLNTAIKEKNEPLEAAIAIGNAPHIMIAGATSPEKGVDELSIANAIKSFRTVKCRTIDVEVPADSEIIIEGRFLQEKAMEGPFLDLTRTLDIKRKQNIFEITCITHRKDPIYHALLPGGTEHELLMGLPREATMLKELIKLKGIIDFRLTKGSSRWFNAVVQVKNDANLEPKTVFEACFRGHRSLKYCMLVNEDINIDDPNDIEFAFITRTQLDKDLYLFKNQKGSSLDPSADQVTRETCKAGIDATIPKNKPRKNFERIKYG